ncbi:MAG TPA: dihydrodipicolinate synthase family protein [Acidobacteriaceae bacterium]|nr:dihydrodipicolinate synthase family protein [Acidobacteriaceae bacterium]
MLLEGLHIPLTTPFHLDGRLNLHKLASNIARYSKTPAAGLILLAPSAEPTLLSDDETRDLLRTAAQSAAAEKVLIATLTRDSTHSILALATYAATLHYDALLIPPPSIPTTPLELLTHFQIIADRSPLPIILLTTPTHPIPFDAIATLATHPNILGLLTTEPTEPTNKPSPEKSCHPERSAAQSQGKPPLEKTCHPERSAAESKDLRFPCPSPNLNLPDLLARTAHIRREVTVTPTFLPVTHRMQQAAAAQPSNLISPTTLISPTAAPPAPPRILRTRTKTVSFQIIAAHTPTLLASLNAGATAIAPAFAACAPQATYEVFAAWKDADQPLAAEKQLRLLEPAHLAEASPAALKHACDLNGYFGGPPRLPHLPLTAPQRTTLEQSMHPIRN